MNARLCFAILPLALLVAVIPAVRAQEAEAGRKAINAVKPEYPYEARARHWTGSGLVLVHVNAGGYVTSARMLKSTGHRILDEAALKAFRQWRFKPGTVPEVRLPIRYTMSPQSAKT